MQVQRKKKTEDQKKRGENVEEEGQSSISYNSDQEENSSEEANGGGSGATSDGGVNRKSRASRGSATDPQSLYARVSLFLLHLLLLFYIYIYILNISSIFLKNNLSCWCFLIFQLLRVNHFCHFHRNPNFFLFFFSFVV